MPFGYDKLTKDDVILINKRRKEIGLRNLSEGETVTKKDGYIQINKKY